ncbi:MAG: hypothetical protein ACRDUA_00470, partial [Micromonosporaceae bacterium]
MANAFTPPGCAAGTRASWRGCRRSTWCTDDVLDQYGATITERHIRREWGLAAALTETGLSAHVKREAGEIADEAGRVKGAYEDLLGAIAHAFDERRVREFDVLQKFNFLL